MTYKPCDQNKKQTAASLHYGVLSYQESLDFLLPPPLLSMCHVCKKSSRFVYFRSIPTTQFHFSPAFSLAQH